MTRAEAVAQLKAIWAILNADLDAALAYGRQVNTAYAQRALVRAHFALVEGLSYQLRQISIASLQGTDLLTPVELALLKEERFSIDEEGRPRATEQYLPFPQSLLFSIRCYVKNHGADFQPDLGGSGWSAMRKATEIRNKVTHPKSSESLELSDDDLRAFVDAATWWKATMLAMFEACEESDEFWRKQLEGTV
jgi:hypothetical protein